MLTFSLIRPIRVEIKAAVIRHLSSISRRERFKLTATDSGRNLTGSSGDDFAVSKVVTKKLQSVAGC